GEDLLFGILLSLCFGEARVGHLSWVAAHEPMEVRRFWPGEMQRSASGIDHSRLVSALLDGFTPDPEADPARNLRALGEHLTSLGSLAPADFDERGRLAVLGRAEAFAEELERRLEAWRDEPEAETPGGALWAEDVRNYLALLRQHAARPDFAVPLDLLYGREPEEARRLAQHLLSDYGRLLTVWPDLVAAARELRAQGVEMAEEVR
ncbi:MAG TPA: hypothetical protein VEL74_03985, partial [Thermoanaerobaculia bacterium]|nr:hypothetical protein [Thermoanaerobaculia bacterium]